MIPVNKRNKLYISACTSYIKCYFSLTGEWKSSIQNGPLAFPNILSHSQRAESHAIDFHTNEFWHYIKTKCEFEH